MSPDTQTPRPSGTDDRTSVLRRLLVATVDATPVPRRRRRFMGVAVATGIAAALVGGAISATAIIAPSGTVDELAFADEVKHVLDRDTELYGEPIVASDSGHTEIEVGARPEGATMLIVLVLCREVGNFTIEIEHADSAGPSLFSCADDSLSDLYGGYLGVSGNYHRIDGDEPPVVTVDSPDAAGYDVWISWGNQVRPELPPASAAQEAAIADGVVTEDEYRAGFERYRACVEAGGYELHIIDLTGPLFEYGTPVEAEYEGVSGPCFALELEEIDMEWQDIVRDDGEYGRTLRECAIAHGLEPRETGHRIGQQLQEEGISLAVCFEEGADG